MRKERRGDGRYWPVTEIITVLHPSDHHSLIRIDNQPGTASRYPTAMLELPLASEIASVVNKPAQSIFRRVAIAHFLT
jgi:hypothetical protein